MLPVKNTNMSIMEGIMECREHLTSDENSFFIGSIDSNFESDEWREGQRAMNN